MYVLFGEKEQSFAVLVQVGPKLLDSSHPTASAFQLAGAHYHEWSCILSILSL
jgi:hypothetical protein